MSGRILARMARSAADEAMRPNRRRPLIVGELNPLGGRDEFALFPLPANRSGGRLAAFLGLCAEEYIARFDRTNLCREDFCAEAARERAAMLLRERRPAYILLGRKVCAAFGVEYAPFTVDELPELTAAILPHPSGKNLAWNDRASWLLAREAVSAATASPLSAPPLPAR